MFYLFAFLLVFSTNIVCADELIKDPLQHFINHSVINEGDELYKFELDITEDGIDDMFITSTNTEYRNAKMGALYFLLNLLASS